LEFRAANDVGTHIPNADRGIVMEKRVTSLEVGKFETCRLLGISDSKLQEE
jgi:hypothetical protein